MLKSNKRFFKKRDKKSRIKIKTRKNEKELEKESDLYILPVLWFL